MQESLFFSNSTFNGAYTEHKTDFKNTCSLIHALDFSLCPKIPPVYRNTGAIDVARCTARKKHHSAGNVFRAAESAVRILLGHCFLTTADLD